MSIVDNKKAFFDYFIEERYEAGLVLEGWEVLLLNDSEIRKLIGKVEQRGYTLVPLNMHFSKGRVKCEIGLARGKKQHDKREASKEKDWEREKARIVRGQLS